MTKGQMFRFTQHDKVEAFSNMCIKKGFKLHIKTICIKKEMFLLFQSQNHNNKPLRIKSKMLRTIGNIIYDYYQFFILPFLSISIFYAMEYMSRGVEFFVNEKGVKWKFLSFCALMQFFVSLVVILSVSAMFRSDALQEYQTLQLVAIILLGTTPFNISILICVAIKLEIYRLMRNRYEKEFKEMIHTDSLLQEALTGKPQSTQQENKLKELAQTHTTQTESKTQANKENDFLQHTQNKEKDI